VVRIASIENQIVAQIAAIEVQVQIATQIASIEVQVQIAARIAAIEVQVQIVGIEVQVQIVAIEVQVQIAAQIVAIEVQITARIVAIEVQVQIKARIAAIVAQVQIVAQIAAIAARIAVIVVRFQEKATTVPRAVGMRLLQATEAHEMVLAATIAVLLVMIAVLLVMALHLALMIDGMDHGVTIAAMDRIEMIAGHPVGMNADSAPLGTIGDAEYYSRCKARSLCKMRRYNSLEGPRIGASTSRVTLLHVHACPRK